jgi:hypothetical protein
MTTINVLGRDFTLESNNEYVCDGITLVSNTSEWTAYTPYIGLIGHGATAEEAAKMALQALRKHLQPILPWFETQP